MKSMWIQKFSRALTLGLSAVALLAIDIGSASAQLEEVLVTARKREEPVRNIPVAVTIVTGRDMENYNLKRLQDVTELTPQLMIFRGGSGNAAGISVRGISPNTSSIGLEQSVAVILDGVYYGQGRFINDGLFDAAQVEILKGPQALFFGKNATAGAINIRTNDPGDEFEMLGRVGYEVKAEQVYTEGVISAPVSDKLGLRLAVRYANMFGGYAKNEAGPGTYAGLPVLAPKDPDWPGSTEMLARLTLLFTPSEDLTIRLKSSYSAYDSVSTSATTELRSCPFSGESQVQPGVACTGDWKYAENPFPVALAATNPLINRKDGELFDDYVSYGFTGDVEYDTDIVSLTTTINYQHLRNNWGGDFDSSGAPAVYAGEWTGFNAFSAEFRGLTTLDGPFNVMLGMYHQSTKRKFDQDVIFAGAFNAAAEDPTDQYTAYEKHSATDGSTYALFGQLIWAITDAVEFTGGARYTHETKNSFFEQPYVNPGFLFLFTEGRVDDNQKWNDISPEATITWEATEDLTVYGAYRQGFKSGGFSISGILGAISGSKEDFAFDREKSKGFEGGVKASLFDNSLQVEVEAYHYKFIDLQIDFFNSPTFAFITENAGVAKTTGAELQFHWAPPETEGLLINGSIAYNDGRYGDFIAPCWAGQTPTQGCTIIDPTGAAVPKQQLAGHPRNLAPEWALALGVDYDRPISDNLVLGVSLNGSYRSSFSTNAFDHFDDYQKGYFMMNAAIRLGGDGDSWQFSVIGKNLTNKYAFFQSGDSPSSGGGTGTAAGFSADRRSTANVPRTVAFELSVRY